MYVSVCVYVCVAGHITESKQTIGPSVMNLACKSVESVDL